MALSGLSVDFSFHFPLLGYRDVTADIAGEVIPMDSASPYCILIRKVTAIPEGTSSAYFGQKNTFCLMGAQY